MKNIFLVLAFVIARIFVFAQSQAPAKLFCDKSNSTITYSMNHPLHSWTGVSKDISSVTVADVKNETISQVAVSVKISSFDSKNANRDSHAIEVTDALKYPNITFSSKSIKQEGKKLTVEGTLVFHGISKDISFEANESVNKNKIEVKGGFEIKMTEFNVDPPSLMGFATDDEIKITFDVVY